MTSRAANLIPLCVDGVHILPVLHEKIEYADWVRRTIEELEPDAVAVEIPSSLETLWLQAIDRLPQISVLLYENLQGRTIYLPVQPADPLVEAARSARERGLKIRCSDLDMDGYADHRDPLPDAYALPRLGIHTIYQTYQSSSYPRDPDDTRREACMAFHCQALIAEGAERVLLLCGMHHAQGVAEQLGTDQAIPLTAPQRLNARLVNLHPDSVGEVLGEIPFHIAAYEARRLTLPAAPAPAAAARTTRHHGPFKVLSGGDRDDTTRTIDAINRAARTAPPGPHEQSPPGPLDRLRSQLVLLDETEQALVATAPDEEVHAWQRITLARFSRNLALLSGQLVPDLYDLLAAARSCVSENYSWELHRLAVAYPAQQSVASDLATALIRADEIFDGVRRIRLHRLRRRPKQPDWRKLFKHGRRKERWPGEWLEGFDTEAICSYPPEDVVIEEFGRYLKSRGKRILSEEAARTVPFTTSVMDGIDIRETIRHWAERKIFVRELGRIPGGVGSVVIIFDEDEAAYPYAQTWLGEHEQESDLAFYSTEPAQGIVGPGICRVTYGGMMMSYPPRRMLDVWSDPDYRLAETRAEQLLLAGLDYSTDSLVVHVGPSPPRSIFRQIAGRVGLKILHIPLGTVSPTTIKKIRVMHILSGYNKREIAKDFIW